MIIIQNQPINMIPQAMHTVSAEGLNLQPEEAQVYPPANNYASIRDALLRLGIKATYRAIQSDNFVQDTSGWKLSAEGVGYFAEGNIGGWNINATTIYSDGNNIILDSANKKIESGNYVSGVNGEGFHISEDLFETANISARGLIRTAVFQKDVISSVGGNFMVIDSDMLNVDMTALDASTLTTKATTTFSVGDILRIKDGTDDEWLEVTAVNGAVYTVTRDKNSDYAADTNPTWKKGATVVNYGQSGDGGIFMTASESNAPYLSVFTHAGSPWTDLTTRLRVGNLNGYLGYTTDKYGIGIGETTKYLKYDPTNGLRLRGEINSSTITGGTVQTASSGQRLVLASNQLKVYDSSNTTLLEILGSTSETLKTYSDGTRRAVTLFENTDATADVLYIEMGAGSGRAINISNTGLSTTELIKIQSSSGIGISMIGTNDNAGVLGKIIQTDLDKTGFFFGDNVSNNPNNTGLVEIVSGATSGALKTCLFLSANNTADYSHIRFGGSPAPASSAPGDFWFDGSELKVNIGGTIYKLDKTAV